MQNNSLKHLLDSSLPLFQEAISIKNNLSTQDSLPKPGDLFKERKTSLLHEKRETSLPFLSVIIPTYNRPQYLLDAARSVEKLGNELAEIIVVQDSGNELPAEILAELKSINLDLIVLRHETNHGLGASRNTGAFHARGTWLCFLDDDDFLIADGVRAFIQLAKTSTSSYFIYGDHVRHIFDSTNLNFNEEIHKRPESPYQLLNIENKICCGSFIVEKKAFFAEKGYRQDFYVHEDYNLHLRLTTKQFGFKYQASPSFIYNIRQQARMNVGRRLYWFATANLNHILFRVYSSLSKGLNQVELHNLELEQTINHYQHVARALREGTELDSAKQLVFSYYNLLEENGSSDQLKLEKEVCAKICPEIMA